MPLTVSKIIKFNRIHESFLTSPLHLMMLLLKFQRRRRRSPRVLPFLIGLPRHRSPLVAIIEGEKVLRAIWLSSERRGGGGRG